MLPPTPGQIVELTFLDHVEDGDEPMQCIAYGIVVAVTAVAITIDSWCCTDKSCHENNKKRFVILRAVISKCLVLEPGLCLTQ